MHLSCQECSQHAKQLSLALSCVRHECRLLLIVLQNPSPASGYSGQCSVLALLPGLEQFLNIAPLTQE